MEERMIGVADLRLDGQNPRLEPAADQRDIIAALLDEQGDKLVNLAEDIASNGLSPIDGLLVIRGPRSSYIVVEGNRRISALKLLANPDLIDNAYFSKRFRAAAKDHQIPYEVPCVIAPSRGEAKHWQDLRHAGELEGRGTVRWNAEAVQRFHRQPGSHGDRGMRFADAIEKAFPRNEALLTDLRSVRKKRITTLGRLAGDPTYRDRGGFEITDAGLVIHQPPGRVERGLGRVLRDLATTHTVSDLKTHSNRRDYLASIAKDLPSDTTYSATGSLLAPGLKAKSVSKPTIKPVKVPAPSKTLFDGVVLVNLGGRVADILRELQRLDIEQYPNSAAVLTRVVLELAVTAVVDKKGWPSGTLRAMVKTCLHKMDPSDKDERYARVRMGLDDGTSLFAVASIQGLVHKPDFWPAPVDLRAIAAGYSPFLAALDDIAKP